MKKFCLIGICLLIGFVAVAQQQIPLDEKRYTDSLEKVLSGRSANPAKAGAAFLLVDYWKVKDSIRCKGYLIHGKKLAGRHPYLNALSLFYEGQYYWALDQKKSAIYFKKAEKALSAFNTKEAYSKRASALFNYALMEKNTKGYDFITRITLNHVIPLAKKSGGMQNVGHYYSQLATVLMNNYQFSKAAEYAEKAIELLEKNSPASVSLVFAYLGGVSIYCYDQQPEKAKKLLDKAFLLLRPYPSSMNYTLYYYNESLYYTTIKHYSSALASADRGILLAKKYNQKQLFQQFFFRKYDIYKQQNAFDKARQTTGRQFTVNWLV
jgi:two-component system NarL family sensor kinase